MDWGDVPTWISAVVATLALTAAGIAAWGAWRLYQIESTRDVAQAERERTRYAERVAAWVAVRVLDSRIEGSGVVLSNGSGAMLFDVNISVNDHEGRPLEDISLAMVPPGEFFIEHNRSESYRWEFPNMISVLDGILRPVMKAPKWCVTGVRFRDAANNHWQRRGNRLLTGVDQ